MYLCRRMALKFSLDGARQHKTPSALHKIFPSTSVACWRCICIMVVMHQGPTINELSAKVLDNDISFTPQHFLLHVTTIPKSQYFKSLAMHMIIVTHLCIAIHQKSPYLPTVKEWLLIVKCFTDTEELIHVAHDTNTYIKTWALAHISRIRRIQICLRNIIVGAFSYLSFSFLSIGKLNQHCLGKKIFGKTSLLKEQSQ